MPLTSGTYNFQSIEIELLIREAFERIGILGEYVEPQKLSSARRSINLLLLEWMNKSVNLWTIKGSYLGLTAGQRQYILDPNVSDIIQINVRTSLRQLNGIPQTNTLATYDTMGGGTPLNAFDDNPNTICLQTSVNGNISYDYGEGNTEYITFFGFVSSQVNKPDLTYQLVVEANNTDPTIAVDWFPILNIPMATYTSGIPYFFDIPSPSANRYYRVRAINTLVPLNFAEVYFNNNTVDTSMTNISHYEYNLFPNKFIRSRPTVYYLDRQPGNPILNIWPTADSQYNCLFYSYMKMMQDAGLYTDTLEIPARLYPALIWGLSWQLALKYTPQMVDMMKVEYDNAFATATTEDSENVSIYINSDYE